ncbi:type II toxin-antitoxin system RelE/ParE family toxin [Joostella atrarenae]|uniref:Type II toxin-antitoxin system RelE/ParE family toxin n=1 Tax=Joostella atrarenae TaxID=679257 RepID=A0ABS9IZH5_9FLAO|nr:type II toxin-antitoxin system RelE/ParE family toxin [Joostella atrarenae]MCF8713581.1 type II toxin-antitoxin system RelE/ParE family toxin [Joostella atrarenae]
MELEVYWLEFTENKLEDIYSYHLIKASKIVAEKLVNGIVDTTIGIEKHPERGQVEFNLKHRKQEFRYLLFKNYKIIYWINYDFKRIEIVNIFDSRQDPGKIEKT